MFNIAPQYIVFPFLGESNGTEGGGALRRETKKRDLSWINGWLKGMSTKGAMYIIANCLRIEFGDVYPDQLDKSAGDYRNKDGGYWVLPFREVVNLGLENRIIND